MSSELPGLPDWLAHRASVLPSHAALVEGARTITYAELDGWAEAVASALRHAGIEPGDRVALLAANSAEFAAAVHGVSRAGAIRAAQHASYRDGTGVAA